MKRKAVLRRFCVILLLLLAAVLLMVNITADGPVGFSNSIGLFFDPPSKCHNARNKVLFGTWVTDDWTPYIHSPLYTFSQMLVFRIFGVGYAQMRYLTVALTIASIFLIYLITAGSIGHGWGIIAMLIATVSFPTLVFGRSGLLEPYIIFFILLSVWCFLKSYQHGQGPNADDTRRAAIWLFVSAASASLAFLSKPLAAYYVAAFLIMALVHPPYRGVRPRIIALVTVSIPVLTDVLLLRFLNSEHLYREGSHWLTRAVSQGIGYRWIHQPFVAGFEKCELPVVLLAILALYWVHRIFLRRGINTRNAAVVLLSLTLLLGSQLDGFVAYRPIRYYAPLFAVSFILAVCFAAAVYRWMVEPGREALRGFVKPFFWLVIGAFLLKFGVVDLLVKCKALPKSIEHEHWRRMGIAAGTAALLLLLVGMAHPYISRGMKRLRLSSRKALFLILALPPLFYYLDGNQKRSVNYIEDAEFTLYNFSKYLGENYRDVVIAGPSPSFAVMENKHVAIKAPPDYRLNWDFMRQERHRKVTHIVFTETAAQEKKLKMTFRGTMRSASLIEKVRLNGTDFKLYAVDLQPLQFSAEVVRNSNEVTLTAKNPDPRNPQRATFIMIKRRDGEPRWVSVKRLVVPLSDKKSVKAELHPELSGDVEVYAIRNTAWIHAKYGRQVHGRLVWDESASGLQALRLRSKGSVGTDHDTGTLICEKTLDSQSLILAVSLKGSLQSGSRIILEWYDENRLEVTRVIRPEMIDSEEYTNLSFPVRRHESAARTMRRLLSFALPTGARADARETVRVSFMGEGTLYLNDLLIIDSSRESLEEKSLWHETIHIQSGETDD